MLTRHGRATPLLWLTVDTATLKDHRNEYEYQVLVRLAEALPTDVKVCIVADRGFGDQKLYRVLREELTFAQIDRHSTELEEMDVEGILAFAERVLPSASNLWVQSSFAQKQRLQQVFFPEGIRFDGKRLVGTGVTLPVFNYLSPVSGSKKELVDLTGIEPVTS